MMKTSLWQLFLSTGTQSGGRRKINNSNKKIGSTVWHYFQETSGNDNCPFKKLLGTLAMAFWRSLERCDVNCLSELYCFLIVGKFQKSFTLCLHWTSKVSSIHRPVKTLLLDIFVYKILTCYQDRQEVGYIKGQYSRRSIEPNLLSDGCVDVITAWQNIFWVFVESHRKAGTTFNEP